MKNKFKATNFLLIVLVVLTSVFFSFKNDDPENKNKQKGNNTYFKLAENLTENDYLPNTVIFKLKESNRDKANLNSINVNSVNDALNELGVILVNKVYKDAEKPAQMYSAGGEKMVDLSLIFIVNYNSGVDIESAVNEIYNTGEVEYAQPKYIYKVNFTPNDPSLGSQYFINKIQAPAAWDLQQGDTNVVIGIVDSGIDWDHPDLAANVKINYADPINGIDDDADGYIDNYRGWDLGGADYNNIVGDNNPMIMGSNNSHGSHVSGDASAVTNNGTGVAGPGFKSKLMGIKCAADNDTRGPGGQGYILTGTEGIKYAADHGCSIINCSWGGGGGGQYEQDVIAYATINKNALVVCAAGNNSSSLAHYPSAYKYALSVASTTSSDVRSSFSNYGTTIDVCAPGSGIYSTIYNNSYTSFDGTSMASPIVAGVGAIVKSHFPSYSALQVGEKVRVTCDNIDTQNPSYIGKLGKGRVNMHRALTINSPSVRLNTYTVTDGNNNIPQPNDTIRIAAEYKNYLDATTNVSAVITSSTAGITILNGSSTLGAIPTLGTVNNNSNPYSVKISSTVAANTIAEFKITYTDGSYSDFEYFTVVINPSYFDMNVNKITTTINSRGNFGFNDYSSNLQGTGFKYNNGTNLLFEGGLMCAVSNTKVSDVVRGSNASVQNVDFTNITPFQITIPGIRSNQDGNALFNDNGAGASKIGIEVKMSSYAFTSIPDEDYVILKYTFKNTNATAVSNFYAGLYGDWDVGVNGDLNKADWDAANQLGYIWRTDNTPSTYTGMSLLSASNPNYWAIDNDNTVAGNPWGVYDNFTDVEKFQALSSGIGRQQAGGTGTGRDVSNVLGSGPYTIPANGELEIAFAILAGDNLNDLKANALAAKNKYNTVLSVVNYNSEIPNSYSLSQNYPNPFNPTTNLEFGISKQGFVSLKVYDLAGKEVATLVNNQLNPGTYSYRFDATNLSSGAYFYKLESNGFIETKKMFLIK